MVRCSIIKSKYTLVFYRTIARIIWCPRRYSSWWTRQFTVSIIGTQEKNVNYIIIKILKRIIFVALPTCYCQSSRNKKFLSQNTVE